MHGDGEHGEDRPVLLCRDAPERGNEAKKRPKNHEKESKMGQNVEGLVRRGDAGAWIPLFADEREAGSVAAVPARRGNALWI